LLLSPLVLLFNLFLGFFGLLLELFVFKEHVILEVVGWDYGSHALSGLRSQRVVAHNSIFGVSALEPEEGFDCSHWVLSLQLHELGNNYLNDVLQLSLCDLKLSLLNCGRLRIVEVFHERVGALAVLEELLEHGEEV
jgi:hypothetical protein